MFLETGQSFFISIIGRRVKVIAIAASGAIVTEPIKAAKIQQEYEKLAVDSKLKAEELQLEREQKRAVAIGAT